MSVGGVGLGTRVLGEVLKQELPKEPTYDEIFDEAFPGMRQDSAQALKMCDIDDNILGTLLLDSEPSSQEGA